VNLADDLQQWLARGTIGPELLPQVREELQEIVKALDTGESISPIPAIPPRPRPMRPDSEPAQSRLRSVSSMIAPLHQEADMALTVTRSAGMLLLAIWLILTGLAGLVALPLPGGIMSALALIAGVLILVGR
jgi:hypothetical protein